MSLLSLPSLGLISHPSVGVLVNNLLQLLIAFAIPLAFISLVYSAYALISSAGRPEAYATAKKNVTYLVIGIFLIVFSAVFVRAILSFFKF